MEKLESIAEQIRTAFDAQTTARDQALTRARALTRACALSIRAVHRDETDVMQAHLDEARQLAGALRTELADYPAGAYPGSAGAFLQLIRPGHSSRYGVAGRVLREWGEVRGG